MAVPMLQLNSTNVLVSQVRQTDQRMGTVFEALNGAKAFDLRAIRRTWTLRADGVDASTVAVFRGVYASATTITYRDESSATHSCVVAEEPLDSESSIVTQDALYYDVTLVLTEAL